MVARQIRAVVMASALLVAMMVATAAPAAAQYPPPPSDDEAVGPTSVAPGEEPTFEAAGFEAETTVAVEAFSQAGGDGAQEGGEPLAVADSAEADVEGVVVYALQVPCGTAAGPATIEFTGPGADGEVRTVSTEFMIEEDPAEVCTAAGDGEDADEDEGGLAATGAAITNGMALAAIALLAGAAFVVAGRKRRSADVDVA